jgi:signal transduction histidine kinase
VNIGTSIHVMVREADGQLVIQVRDHGPGIPLPDLSHLFERFYRGAIGWKLRSGTGLGL